MKYSLEQLVTFVTVASSGSFSAAARKLKKSQSTVSTSIINLEDEFNIILFHRNFRDLKLTSEGETLLKLSLGILERCNLLEKKIELLNQVDIEKQVKIAINIPYSYISYVVKKFTENFSEVDLIIKEPIFNSIEQMVLNNEVDLGIVLSSEHNTNKINFVQLGKLTMVHTVSVDHELAKKIPVTISDLHLYKKIILEHQQLIYSTEFLDPPSVLKVENYNSMLNAVLSGIGWASIPLSYVQEDISSGNLVELKQYEYPYSDWIVGVDLIWSKQAIQGKAKNWLINKFVSEPIFDFTQNQELKNFKRWN